MLVRLIAILLLLLATQVLTAEAAPDGRCAQVGDLPAFAFRGRTLEVTPDITAPDLRRANALLSAGCQDDAIELARSYASTHPDDYRADYFNARLEWMNGDTATAELTLTRSVQEHPDFLSAKVLLASLYAEQQARRSESRPLLDRLSLQTPTDLWVFLAGLKLDTFDSPSPALRDELLEIAKDPRFPPNARETATRLGKSIPNPTSEQYLAFFWADLEYESQTPMPCKINHLATRLILIYDRYEDAQKLLESPRALAADCLGMEANRILLAEAYLFQASKIHAGPSPANAALVSKANELLRGDWSGLANSIVQQPQYHALLPFVASATAPTDVDHYGRTQLCVAVMASAVDAVRAQLDRGADPNGGCDGRSLIQEIVRTATNDPVRGPWQRDIVRMLRAAGARVTPRDIEWCTNRDNGPNCRESLLPLLQP